MNIVLLGLAGLMLYGIRLMSSPKSAVLGNTLGAGALLAAVLLTLVDAGILTQPLLWCGMAVGAAVGVWMAVKALMIKMPQMVALLNGLGGGASALVGMVLALQGQAAGSFAAFTTSLTIAVGSMTFSGSLVAAAKLHGLAKQRPQELPHHAAAVVLAAVLTVAALFFGGPAAAFAQLVLALGLGVLVTMRVGGADMPITISLLNSLSGVAGAIAGFALQNPLLVAVGGIVGASGFILTQIMCWAMNRSLAAILTGRTTISGTVLPASGEKVDGDSPAEAESGDAPGQAEGEGATEEPAPVRQAAQLLAQAETVVIVPGYGMALASAQHQVQQLAALLQARGKQVKIAVHPVAGRMPGHMNVLLAEVDIPYDMLYDLDVINDEFKSTDAAVVVGANDVVNPAAQTAEGTPIYGMPVLKVSEAKHVIVCNLDRGPGYAGVPNALYDMPHCVFVEGDAAQALQDVIAALSQQD